MKVDFRSVLLIGCGTVALATAARAQVGAPPPQTSQAQPSQVSEIVVTASKRAERLQEVPVAVTVVNSAQLAAQNITNAVELSQAVPEMTNGSDQLRIRGIGTFSFARTSEASVGVVLDGVALANAGPVEPQIFDASQIEVLAGPQGTLFGRNASAGIVNIITNAPDPSKFAAAATADVGTRDSQIAQGFVNIPLSSDAALRITGSYVKEPDTTYNVYRDDSDADITKSIRARFLWEPTDDLKINLIGDYSRQSIDGGGGWAVYSSTPGSELTSELASCNVTPSVGNNDVCLDAPVGYETETFGGSAQIDYRIGHFLLTSITAYRGFDDTNFGDSDSTPLNILDVNSSLYSIRNVSQEFRVTSPTGGIVDYVAGLYYFHSAQDYAGAQAGTLNIVPPPLTLGQDFTTSATSASYAGFGQATIHATKRLRFIVGGRLNRDEVDATTTRTVNPGSVAPFGSILPVSGSVADNSFSYRLGAQYDLTGDTMAYFTFNRGYKGPAINDQAASGTVPLIVNPEIPNAWELGLKTDLLDHRLAIDAAAFYTRTTNFQTQYYDPLTLGYIFGNAPELTTKGISIDYFGHLTDHLSINGGLIYDDATYGKGYYVACSQEQTAAEGCLAVAGGTTQDAEGTPLDGAPKFKITTTVNYRRPINDKIDGYVEGDVVYSTRVYYGQGYDPLNSVAPNAIVGARIGIRTENDRYGVALYVRNLFDNRVPDLTIATPIAAQLGDPRSYAALYGSDSFRVVGISLDARY